MKKICLWTFTLLLIVSCNDSDLGIKNQTPSHAVKVKIAPLLLAHDTITMTAGGTLSYQNESTLSFYNNGIIKSILFNEGEKVKKGQLLAVLDNTESKAKYNLAKENYDKSKRDNERMENLYKDSVITLEQRQNFQTGYETARNQLQLSKYNLDHTVITAPDNGVVLIKHKEIHETVSSGQPVITFGSDVQNRLLFSISLSDKEVLKIKRNDKAIVRFDAFPESVYKGNVTEISDLADKTTGTYRVKILLEGNNMELKSGLMGHAVVYTNDKNNQESYKVPMTAIVNSVGTEVTLFVTDNKKTVSLQSFLTEDVFDDYITIKPNKDILPKWLVVRGASVLKDRDSIIVMN